LHGYTKESAIKAFNYYDCAGWKDSKGNKVRNWKQKMQAVWFKDENKEPIRNNQNMLVLFLNLKTTGNYEMHDIPKHI
jgi:hypothetical protein